MRFGGRFVFSRVDLSNKGNKSSHNRVRHHTKSAETIGNHAVEIDTNDRYTTSLLYCVVREPTVAHLSVVAVLCEERICCGTAIRSR